MNHLHAAVWIDHREAKIFHVDADTSDVAAVQAPSHHMKRHPSHTAETTHSADASHFHRDVARALEGAETILVLGPGNAKLELMSDWKNTAPKVASKVAAVETVDHPTDGQIVAHARHYFKAAGHMRGNVV
jgi:stalled ribosome rescue protein Dom34